MNIILLIWMIFNFFTAAISVLYLWAVQLILLLLRCRASPFRAIDVHILVNWLISAKLKVTFSNFFGIHYVFNLYLWNSVWIVLTEILFGHTYISRDIISIGKLLHFLFVKSFCIFFHCICRCQLLHTSSNPFIIVIFCICCGVIWRSRSKFKVCYFEVHQLLAFIFYWLYFVAIVLESLVCTCISCIIFII